jgi:catechol 2,3-dioxygenase-like lactoylglutathione lyase family enzyme
MARVIRMVFQPARERLMTGQPLPAGERCMPRTTRLQISAVVAGLALAGGHAVLSGQAPTVAARAGTAVIGAGSFSPIVADLQKTLAFYALLGFEVPDGTAASPRPFSVNPRLHSMLGTNGANERHVNARIPGGFTLEPIEFAAIDRRPVRPRIQDPGAITLVVYVRDVDALLAKATQAGVPVLTPGGRPVALARKARAVLLEDPDGRPVELRQADPLPDTGAPAASNVIGSRLSMTVADTDRTMRLYRDRFGFGFEGHAAFTADADLQALTGLKGGQVRHSSMTAPGGRMAFELLEFKGVAGTPLRSRIQDPGSARIQLRVGNADAVLGMVTATGSRAITAGDKPVALPPNLLGVMVPDPDNLYLTLLESCDGCAPRAAALEYVATGQEPWYATWKLNPARSQYENGFQGSRSTVTRVVFWEGGLTYVTDSVNAEGQKGHTEWSAKFDGKDYPVTGVATVDSYAIQRIDDRTYTVIAKKNGVRTTLSTATISADGKTRTVRQTGTQVGGRDVNNTLVYERQ